MIWLRYVSKKVFLALIVAVTINAFYFGLLFTKTFHGLAVAALGPAIGIVNRYLDPKYAAGSYRYVEEFGVNIIIYTFLVFVILLAIDISRYPFRKN